MHLVTYKTPAHTDAAAITRLLTGLQTLGWQVYAVDDGEGAENCKGETVKQTVDRVTAVEDARVYLSKGDLGHRACMYFVLGNSPWEVMADCSSYPEWDADLTLVEEAANLEGL